MHAVNLPDMPLLIDLPAPKFVASVELTRSELSDSGVGTQHFSYSASEWCRDSVQALFDSIKDYRGDSNRFYQRNNEAISRVIPYRGIDVIVDHSAVFKTLHADLNNGDVKDFMNSFAARSAVHRLTFAGLDVYGRALDRSLSEKASSPQGLWRNGSKSEKRSKELKRAAPVFEATTAYVFNTLRVQNRVDAVVQLTSSKVSDHHGYSADAVSFELQKLTLTILGALPENILRGNLEVYDALSNVAFHDYSHGGWDDKYSKALQLSEAYATFKGLVNKNQ